VLCRLRVVAQVPEHVVDVRELLLEVALVRLEALDQLLACGKRAEEVTARPGAVTVMSVMH
jgi:hypothetical protein